MSATERSDQAYATYIEASQKFDYFVVSISLAMVAYLGAAFRPVRLGWNPSTLELVSLGALLLSAIAGLMRVQSNITLLGTSQKRLWEQEAAGAMKSVALKGGPALNEGTGEVLLPAQMMRDAQLHEVGAKVIEKHLEHLAASSGRWYRTRDFLLVLGLALLVFARVLAAYIA